MGDVYVVLDDTQFKKKYFENRNKIRFPNKEGWIWLNVPVKNKSNLPNMLDVELVDNTVKQKHLNTIKTSYGKCPYFQEIFHELKEVYLSQNDTHLVEINIRIIKYALQKFKINIPVLRVSEMKNEGAQIGGEGSDLVLSLVKAVEANTLVAGIFEQSNIEVLYQDFKHPVYNQHNGGFIPYMSFLDLLFNYGENAVGILPKSGYTI